MRLEGNVWLNYPRRKCYTRGITDNVADFIADWLIGQSITDVFGYQGGMAAYIFDALGRRSDKVTTHFLQNEQGAGFAACGYAQSDEELKPAVCIVTSGPGVTNLATPIANAYYESIPMIIISGQVHSSDLRHHASIRQVGFQEMDAVSLCSGISKAQFQVLDAKDISGVLQQAWEVAVSGRPGPVLIDLPIDISRTPHPVYIDVESSNATPELHQDSEVAVLENVLKHLKQAKRPVIVWGGGVHCAKATKEAHEFSRVLGIPSLSSLPAVDVDRESGNFFGLIGTSGNREANLIMSKADLIVAFGARLIARQTGGKLRESAPMAKVVRVDIDPSESIRQVVDNEIFIQADAKLVLKRLINEWKTDYASEDWLEWTSYCKEVQQIIVEHEHFEENQTVDGILAQVPSDAIITADVGQNMLWVAQSRVLKGQRVLFSSSFGSMGFSLPAAIGVKLAHPDKEVWAFMGDGGLQMNIQELQFIAENNLDIKICVLNNHALGNIVQFQDVWFEQRHSGTVRGKGYSAPEFRKIFDAFGIPEESAILVEMVETTRVFPKQIFGSSILDAEPKLSQEVLQQLTEASLSLSLSLV